MAARVYYMTGTQWLSPLSLWVACSSASDGSNGDERRFPALRTPAGRPALLWCWYGWVSACYSCCSCWCVGGAGQGAKAEEAVVAVVPVRVSGAAAAAASHRLGCGLQLWLRCGYAVAAADALVVPARRRKPRRWRWWWRRPRRRRWWPPLLRGHAAARQRTGGN